MTLQFNNTACRNNGSTILHVKPKTKCQPVSFPVQSVEARHRVLSTQLLQVAVPWHCTLDPQSLQHQLTCQSLFAVGQETVDLQNNDCASSNCSSATGVDLGRLCPNTLPVGIYHREILMPFIWSRYKEMMVFRL